MKRYIISISFILLFLIPNLFFALMKDTVEYDGFQENDKVENLEIPCVIRVQDGDTCFEMQLDAYVLCVLLGEIPADFDSEALKAQAVATRTYTLHHFLTSPKHGVAHVCTDPSCCQAFETITSYMSGETRKNAWHRIENAVNDTTGQVLVYGGQLIDATYFSASGGKTEDASSVWGGEVPYLISVDSPGEDTIKSSKKQITLSYLEFFSKLDLPLGMKLDEQDLSVTYTNGNGIKQVSFGGYVFSGVELRTLLGLPSTIISFSLQEQSVVITTTGNGHRVGMSQYGAQAMAVEGFDYTQILSHYYTGTKLITLTEEQIQGVFDKGGNL